MSSTKQSRLDRPLTQSERLQLIGLLTLSSSLYRQMLAIETAVLEIVQEIDRDGELTKPNGNGHVGDAVWGMDYTNADELIWRLGLTVEPENG